VSLLLDSNTAATGEKTETHVENHLQPRNRKPEKVYNSMGFNCLCSKTASVIMRRRNGLAPLETKIPNRTTKRFLTGFTLIELLVVIAIIALLMSILLPTLNRAKEQVRTVICKSNLHQYGLAMRMYLDNNKRRFPYTMEWLYSNRPSGYCMWHDEENNLANHPENAGVLWPYLQAKDIHLCLTFKIVAKKRGCSNPNHNPSIPIKPQYSYSMNAFLGGDGKGMVSNESEVRHPAKVFLFGEENSWQVPGMSCSGCGINDNNLRIGIPPDIVDCFATYHNVPMRDLNKGSANLVFVDGHVGSIKADQQKNGGNFRLAWPRAQLP